MKSYVVQMKKKSYVVHKKKRELRGSVEMEEFWCIQKSYEVHIKMKIIEVHLKGKAYVWGAVEREELCGAV